LSVRKNLAGKLKHEIVNASLAASAPESSKANRLMTETRQLDQPGPAVSARRERRRSLCRKAGAWLKLAAGAMISAAAICCAPAFAAEDRIALVIGNDAYPGKPLNHAVNDARLVAKTLAELGFKVVVKTNVDFNVMRAAVVTFSNLLSNNDAAVFYFSGHGAQYRSKNYLIPIDAKLTSDADLVFNALDVTPILERMQNAKVRHKFLILDACREIPFRAALAEGAAKGLAKMQIPPGTTVAFAAQADAVSEDGKGDNGIYTRNLLREIGKPQIQADLMFQQVSQAVQAETMGRQSPEVQSVAASAGNFFFNESGSSAGSSAVEQRPERARASADTEARVDLEFWSNVKDSPRAEDIRAYLEQFPNGRFAVLARSRIEAIARQQAAAVQPSRVQSGDADSTPPALQPRQSDRTAAEAQLKAYNARIVSRPQIPASSPAVSKSADTPLQSGVIDLGNGVRYSGQYREDSSGDRIPHGKGESASTEFRYVGEFRDGRKHGRGQYTFASGDRYEGDFADDVPSGKGKYRFASGDSYEGEIVAGKITGTGVYLTKGMDRIEGSFINGSAHGHARYLFASGDRYEGEMAAGRVTGKGAFTLKSNDRIVGTFIDGQAQGEAIYYFSNGDRYEGQIKSGALTGKGKYFYSNGLRSEGEYRDGVLKGRGAFYFNDGSSFEGEFLDGLNNARGISILKDGTRREASIIDNVLKLGN
jgi:hypothetical protein